MIRFLKVYFGHSSIGMLCLTLAILTGLAAKASDPSRAILSMDEGWRFKMGDVPNAVDPEYDDHDWRIVDVPHDYVIEGAFSQTNPHVYPGMNTGWYVMHAYLPIHAAVYRKTFNLPPNVKGRRIWLEFDGVFSNSRYWLNGLEVGSQFSGYTRSRFDVTDAADCGGKNVLVVQVDPRYDGWWYEGGGIYRHVRMVIVDPVHIAPDGIFIQPLVENPDGDTCAEVKVSVNTNVGNQKGVDVGATLLSEILDASGKVVAAESSIGMIQTGGAQQYSQEIKLPNASLWSPQHPYLYRLRSTVFISGKIVDQITTNFGARSIHFDANNGFFINGKRLEIQGVNLHEDHAGVGVAMPDRLFTWRLERLKEMGCNAIRMSHNPVEPFLLDECDRMGFLVIAENRHFGDTYEDQTSRDTPAVELVDLVSLVTRDRNHPSIILWSLCNEQWIQNTPEAHARAASMRRRVLELDPSRPVTAAMNNGFDSAEGLITALDIVGINYNPGVYDAVHAHFPNIPIVATEIASEVGTRGVYSMNQWENYHGDRDAGHLAAYSINAGPAGQVVEDAWPPVESRKFVAGAFVWTGFDYKGEPRPFEWPVVNSHYGFMDICGFPKDSYYYYKAWWSDQPVLHLFPHWNWQGMEGKEIDVWVHSNCETVELFLNGVSLGKKTVRPGHHLEWKVKFAPGRLVAKGTYKESPVEDSRETTGEPAAVRLVPDRNSLLADNADLSVVRVEIVDARGRVVPVADNKVTFSLHGPGKLIGVGNGDPSCHEPDKGNSRSAFNGLAQALVQTTHKSGIIELKAESEGLKPCSLLLQSKTPLSDK
jgi:beta-galactosidase